MNHSLLKLDLKGGEGRISLLLEGPYHEAVAKVPTNEDDMLPSLLALGTEPVELYELVRLHKCRTCDELHGLYKWCAASFLSADETTRQYIEHTNGPPFTTEEQ